MSKFESGQIKKHVMQAACAANPRHHEEEMAGALPSQKQQAGIGPVEDVERTSLATVSVGEECLV